MFILCEEAEKIVDEVRKELLEACYVHPPMECAAHGVRILFKQAYQLYTEVDVRNADEDNRLKMRHEAIQVAAMAIRFIFDICDKPNV